MILINEGFHEGWNKLKVIEVEDVIINDKHHALMIKGENGLTNSKSFFLFFNQLKLLRKLAQLVDPTLDEVIDDSKLLGTTLLFNLKRSGKHVNIVDICADEDSSHDSVVLLDTDSIEGGE